MSRPKYFIKTTVTVPSGRTKYEVVKGFSDDDLIAKVGSEHDATKLCEEFERLTDEVARLKAEVERLTDALNKLVKTPPEATGGVRVKVDFWTQYGSRLPSSYETFWENAAKEGKPSV